MTTHNLIATADRFLWDGLLRSRAEMEELLRKMVADSRRDAVSAIDSKRGLLPHVIVIGEKTIWTCGTSRLHSGTYRSIA
jgi:hypothetical protein